MNKWVNGKIEEMTPEEVERCSRVSPESVTMNDALAFFARIQLRPMLATMNADDALSVAPLVDIWEAGAYKIGDVRTYGDQIWRCGQVHDSKVNADVIPGQVGGRAFWFPYHARDRRYARYFVPPTCREDIYMAGEWMIYKEHLYRCKRDYVDRNPEELPEAWEKY